MFNSKCFNNKCSTGKCFSNKFICLQAGRVTASPREGETGEGKNVNQKVLFVIYSL